MADLLSFLKGQEGYSAKPFWDYKQWTSGYGTRGQPGEVIDQPTAERRLADEAGKARTSVTSRFPNVSPSQADALASFTYNLGPGWMQTGGLADLVDKGDWNGVSQRMQSYNKAGGKVLPGLVNRRRAEGQMFLGGPQGETPSQNQTPPLVTGSIPTQGQTMPAQNQAPAPQQMGLIERLMNPLTVAGLSILGDPQRDVGRGFANAGQAAAGLNSRNTEARKLATQEQEKQQFQGLLERMAPTFGEFAPMIAQLGQERGTPLLLELMKGKKDDTFEREKWQTQKGLIEAQTKAAGQREPSATPSDIREYQFSKSQGFEGSFVDWKMKFKTGAPALTATDKKAIFAAEDDIAPLDSSIKALKRAKELNPQSFSGYTAGLRASIGSKLPDWLVPDLFADKASSDASNEFGSLMSFEAIKSMATTLKGATTDQELERFVKILGDPATPPEIRGRTIDRMIELSEAEKAKSEYRVRSLIDQTYYTPGGATGRNTAPPPGGQTDLSTMSTEDLLKLRAQRAGGQ